MLYACIDLWLSDTTPLAISVVFAFDFLFSIFHVSKIIMDIFSRKWHASGKYIYRTIRSCIVQTHGCTTSRYSGDAQMDIFLYRQHWPYILESLPSPHGSYTLQFDQYIGADIVLLNYTQEHYCI